MKTLAERFWPKVQKTDSCWFWLGSTNQFGYGVLTRGRRGEGWVKAHRAAWELTIGPIPQGLDVCHRCDTPACVNPGHLFLGTAKDNMADCSAKGRVSCSHQVKGQHHWKSKITEDDVRAIRDSDESQRALARRFGIPQPSVCLIKQRKSWAHVV